MAETLNRTGGLSQTLTAESLPPELRAKWLEYKNRPSKSHPLYQTASSEYGKAPRGIDVEYKTPEFGKGGTFSDSIGGVAKGQSRSTLDTSIAKHRYMKELDPM